MKCLQRYIGMIRGIFKMPYGPVFHNGIFCFLHIVADFAMSVTQEPSDVNQGQNITLTCQVNIPLTDVTIRWTMAGKKSKKRLRGHLHPHKGTSVVTVRDIRPEDYGIYSCVVSYSLGDRTVLDMKTALLNYGELNNPLIAA